MKRKLFVCIALICAFSVNVLAQTCASYSAPNPAGNALIFYNALGYSNFQASEPAMVTFRAALDPINYFPPVYDPAYSASFHPAGGVPPINPPLTLVNVLNITSIGINTSLRAQFYGKGDALFDSLYDAGNPLAYWSQVYDIRFKHDANPEGGSTDVSSITTNLSDKTSDASYFKEFLKSGGALYIQTVRKGYVNRNPGVEFIIKNFTMDKGYSNATHNADEPIDATSFVFHSGFNDFRCNWNPLETEQNSYPMTWAYPGGTITTGMIGVPLLSFTGNNRAVMMGWRTKEMDPEIGNGLLVVGWAITGWAPQTHWQNISIVSRATFAVIQNLYALMSTTAMFSVNKSFHPDGVTIPTVEDGDLGICYITLKNNAMTPSSGISVTDTLDRCFEYVGNSNVPLKAGFPKDLGDGRTALEWDNISLPANRGSLTIQFEYRIDFNPPCK